MIENLPELLSVGPDSLRHRGVNPQRKLHRFRLGPGCIASQEFLQKGIKGDVSWTKLRRYLLHRRNVQNLVHEAFEIIRCLLENPQAAPLCPVTLFVQEDLYES